VSQGTTKPPETAAQAIDLSRSRTTIPMAGMLSESISSDDGSGMDPSAAESTSISSGPPLGLVVQVTPPSLLVASLFRSGVLVSV
jgi:hypothetical protein